MVGLTLGVCDLTFPARASEPWTLPMIAVCSFDGCRSSGVLRCRARSGESHRLATFRLRADFGHPDRVYEDRHLASDDGGGRTVCRDEADAVLGLVVDGVTELWFVERSLRRYRLLSAQGQALSARMWGRLMPDED